MCIVIKWSERCNLLMWPSDFSIVSRWWPEEIMCVSKLRGVNGRRAKVVLTELRVFKKFNKSNEWTIDPVHLPLQDVMPVQNDLHWQITIWREYINSIYFYIIELNQCITICGINEGSFGFICSPQSVKTSGIRICFPLTTISFWKKNHP